MAWLRVDLGRPYVVTGVAIQGRGDEDQWVTEYRLLAAVKEADGYLEITPRGRRTPVTSAEWGSADGLPTFPGATDRHTPVLNDKFDPVVARYVKLIPVAFHGHRSVRWEVYGYEVPMGMVVPSDPLRTALAAETPGLPRPIVCTLDESAITATSSWGAGSRNLDHFAKFGVLDCARSATAWAAEHLNVKQAWQVDLGAATVVTQIRLQGRATYPQWVTAYCLLASLNGAAWYEVQPTGPLMRTFVGASSSTGIVCNDFFRPFIARFVRINPAAWSTHMSLRAGGVGFPLPPAAEAPPRAAAAAAAAASGGGAGGQARTGSTVRESSWYSTAEDSY